MNANNKHDYHLIHSCKSIMMAKVGNFWLHLHCNSCVTIVPDLCCHMALVLDPLSLMEGSNYAK